MRLHKPQTVNTEHKARSVSLLRLLRGQPSNVSRLVIISLALWAGGFNCFICCAINMSGACCTSEAEASSAVSFSIETEDCSSEHGCCSGDSDQSSDSLKRTTYNQMGAGRCCMLTGRADAPAVLPKSMIDGASLRAGSEPPFAPNRFFQSSRFFDGSPSRDRGGTYLRCCALLI